MSNPTDPLLTGWPPSRNGNDQEYMKAVLKVLRNRVTLLMGQKVVNDSPTSDGKVVAIPPGIEGPSGVVDPRLFAKLLDDLDHLNKIKVVLKTKAELRCEAERKVEEFAEADRGAITVEEVLRNINTYDIKISTLEVSTGRDALIEEMGRTSKNAPLEVYDRNYKGHPEAVAAAELKAKKPVTPSKEAVERARRLADAKPQNRGT